MAHIDDCWKGKHYAFFENTECECFPCHKWNSDEAFNCIFCYCPLFFLGKSCGGNFKILENGSKDCSDCLIPHIKDNYGYIVNKLLEACEERKVK